jgi:RNA polymerase sigma-70 factor (ECF subfamily)
MPPGALFTTTRWTLILEAKSSAEARRAALVQLFQTYWQPLYVLFRKKGLTADAAKDAVQQLAVQLIERDAIDRVDPARGRLRGYLRTAADNLLASQHETATAQKRGAGAELLPIDLQLAERTVAAQTELPDAVFERAWADGVMQRSLARLEREWKEEQRAGPFALVQQFFGGSAPPAYRDAATAHGLSVPQLKSLLHRARGRFRALLREEVADTVATESEVDAEVAALFEVLSR